MDEEDYFSWDLIIKNTVRLPNIEQIEAKMKYQTFVEKNLSTYTPPFLLFYKKPSELD